MLEAIQNRLIYFPTREIIRTPADNGIEFESVRFATQDGVSLHGWWVPSATPPHATVLFFHGNAGNISHLGETIEILHRLGLATLAVDYRGYGLSEGSPTEQGTYLDALAAWRYLVEVRGAEPSQIAVFGRSLGGGVATWLALEREIGALVLESTFTSVVEAAKDAFPWLPVERFGRIRYASIERVQSLSAPILVIHSTDDEVIDFEHGRRLFDAASNPKQFLEISGSHAEGFIETGPAYVEGIDAFFRDAFKPEGVGTTKTKDESG